MIGTLLKQATTRLALRSLKSTPVAFIDYSGRIIEASDAFFDIISQGQPVDPNINITKYCLKPTFMAIKKNISLTPEKYISGRVTIGTWTGQTWTLNAFVYGDGKQLLFIGEHEINSLAQVQESMLKLNQSLVNEHRDIANLLMASKQSEERAQQDSRTDTLTKLGNRRSLDETLAIELARAVREKKPAGLIMADLDHFKSVNDIYGHDVGDKVLEAFGSLIRQCVRPSDIPFRYGGEEFVIVMPGAGPEDSINIADRIRVSLENLTLTAKSIKITASFGVTCLREYDLAESVVHRADIAMYKSKKGGRNRATFEP